MKYFCSGDSTPVRIKGLTISIFGSLIISAFIVKASCLPYYLVYSRDYNSNFNYFYYLLIYISFYTFFYYSLAFLGLNLVGSSIFVFFKSLINAYLLKSCGIFTGSTCSSSIVTFCIFLIGKLSTGMTTWFLPTTCVS